MMMTSTTAVDPAFDTNVVAAVYSLWLMYGRSPTDSSVAPECPKFLTWTPAPNSVCSTDGYDLLDDDAPYPAVMLSPTHATWVGMRTCANAVPEKAATSARANTAARAAKLMT